MNLTVTALFNAIQHVLRNDVLPDVTSEHAKSQVLGAVDVLDKLSALLVWSPDLIREQIAILEAGAAAFCVRAGQVTSGAPEAAEMDQTPPVTQDQLVSALQDRQNRLANLTDWLYADATSLDPEPRLELELLLRDTIQKSLAVERRLIALADYSSMS